jgi:arginyl-tRNA synthetase
MLRSFVRDLIEIARKEAYPDTPSPAYAVMVPKEEGHGAFASNVAMQLAGTLRRPPREIAEALRSRIPHHAFLERVEVAGPGFLNFFLSPRFGPKVLERVLQAGDAYGTVDVGRGERVLLEFVSANPTGPLNVVSARAAAVGDSLARLLRRAGYTVHTEFYINDAGGQIERLGESVEARMLELLGRPFELPEEGYRGPYVVDVARQALAAFGEGILSAPREERVARLADFAMRQFRQREDLEAYGVTFDRWFSERRDLHEAGKVERALGLLKERGELLPEDGALVLPTTRYGDDKDRVVVRSDGRPTYFAADIAYHLDKFERGFDTLIDLLGPDHHGYIARLKAAVAALGHPPERLEILLIQWVRLLRGGEAVSMSKRAGDFVTLAELVEEVGRDAARFFFLLRSHESPLDFDLDLAVQESNENPVFYVQYAHARIASILRQAEGVEGEADFSRLVEPEELLLLRKLDAFEEEVADAAEAREPHRIARYALDLAALFHGFYTRHRVLNVDPPLSVARLALVGAVAQVLRSALDILGVSAPERM